MAYGRHLDNRRIAISGQWFDGSSLNLARQCIMSDPLNPTGPNEMLFAGQTHVRRRTIILVAGAHWRLLANVIEPCVAAMRPFVKLL